ncbi:hypothetical protein HHK36_027649 [Tetracentron sinense]|uniref:RHOMBOID-like protein n=1 Tax=Tetracentron sinense TaxID=13715 RepID=A0A834YDK9_TETSI|nr:hypothetical protein HHK36_027649 [Tetracentron sinense]
MKMGSILASLEVKSGYGAFVADFHIPKNAVSAAQKKYADWDNLSLVWIWREHTLCPFIQHTIFVGASCALFGLLGAMLSELFTNWTIYTNKAAALFTLVVIIAINLAVGILPHVDNFAHIGGFLTGLLFGFVLLLCPQFGWVERRNLPADVRVKSKHKAYQYIFLLVALVLLIVGFGSGWAWDVLQVMMKMGGFEEATSCNAILTGLGLQWDFQRMNLLSAEMNKLIFCPVIQVSGVN